MSDLDLPLAVRMMQDGYLMEIQDLKEKNAELRELVRLMASRLRYADEVSGGGVIDARMRKAMKKLGVDA